MIAINIGLPVEKQIKVMIPVLLLNLHVRCASFSDEQMTKIKNRKQKDDTFRDNELDLLADEDVDSFTGSQADLEGAAQQLFASSLCPQSLCFESLSLKTQAKTVPPTPGTALQQKIESKLEKSLGSLFNIQLQQQMGIPGCYA